MARLFTAAQEAVISNSILKAELKTTGEIRIFVEESCPTSAYERAMYIFGKHKMYQTKARNGVLVYVAYGSHLLYILGDEGIHANAGQQLWDHVVPEVTDYFKEGNFVEGICHAIEVIGDELAKYYPQKGIDPLNELSNEVIYDVE